MKSLWNVKLVVFPKQCEKQVQMLREMRGLETETRIITEQAVTEAQLVAPAASKTSDPNEFVTSITCPNTVSNISITLYLVFQGVTIVIYISQLILMVILF